MTEPEAALRKVCRFLSLSWCTSMLDYHRHASQRLTELDRDVPSLEGRGLVYEKERVAIFALTRRPPDPGRIGRWRTEMFLQQITVFERGAGSLLRDLGYGLGRISNGDEETL